ncbi:hypothetical protein DOTSEDRAFT_68958 [Dothistroma septosporum NZE10]|uniref:NTF2-like domain-containing protein n=1 Tax=Dothistroma septosporum (strain NZE10 / CBS 128990) TaxID=675120 RepID=N1Q586_DOTSN|nr:hypothetical protein DOTSEDRAFT_68958 [Dothistroma septosporum NZE10]
MRSFTTVLASASLLVVSTLAVPNTAWSSNSYGGWGKNKSPSWNPGRDSKCLSDSEAQTVAENFQESIAAYSDALADADFTTDFHDYSDSVIELMDNGCPNSPVALGSATFDSLASFKAGQGAQPPIDFEILNIWHNCNTVTVRWKSAQTPEQVTGIIVIETSYQNSKWMIQTVYSEFNSGAWLVNLGIFTPTNCTA